MYLAVADKQGVPWTALRGTIQNDILKEYIAEKTYIFPPRPSMKLVVDTFEFGTKHVPQWNTISVSGYHIREAGSTALQELAFTLYDGIEYVEWARRAGLDVDDFAPRLSFFFNAHSDFFEELAKYRAARKVWYKVMTERFHCNEPSIGDASIPHANCGLRSDRTATQQQHRSRRDSGDVGGARWNAIAAYELSR